MLEKRSCKWCNQTGLSEKGFCHMCNGHGHQEALEKAEAIKAMPDFNINRFILSISEFTTPEQLSNIMSHYMTTAKQETEHPF